MDIFSNYLEEVLRGRSKHTAPLSITMTEKQEYVWNYYKSHPIKMLLLDGSVGSGKTKLLISLFCDRIYSDRNKGYQYILAGATLPSIRRNFLTDMEAILGREIKLNKENSFKLFGNTVFCFAGKNSDAWASLRGMNSAGTVLGEMTTLHRSFIKEAEARTRKGAEVIFADTNPDSDRHFVKTEYIDQEGSFLDDGKTIGVKNFNFCIDDNSFISDNYKSFLKKSYPPDSALYKRNILGQWVGETEASIYGEYMRDVKYFDQTEIPNMYVGIDLGIGDSTVLIFATKVGADLRVIHMYRNNGKPTGHYIDEIKRYCAQVNFRYENVQIVLPHDSANRIDMLTSITTRYSAYSQVFPMTQKIRPVPVIDMISSTRKHLYSGRVHFMSNLYDLISDLRSYSWRVSDGIIDTTTPEHGKASNSPSNTADAFEYLCFFALGFDPIEHAYQDYNYNQNIEYGRY